MTFRFDENLKFGETAYVRVGVFDEGHGSWGLRYSTASGGSAVAFTARKSNTGSWIEVRTNLTDLACCDRATATLPRGGHLELFDADAGVNGADGDADPDTFGWIEAQRQPFLFALTDHIVELPASRTQLV